jgi:UDP-glucose 4-epimerase
MFKSKIKYSPKRAGERYASSLLNTNLSNKVHKYYGKISLKEYIGEFLKNNA